MFVRSGAQVRHDHSTNIIVAYLSGDEAVVDLLLTWRKQGGIIYLSTVVETEVLSFNAWTNQERNDTEKFLEENFISIPFDRQLSRIAADIRRKNKIKFPDAAIAATAVYTRTPVITRNQKDFNRIKGLRVITI